MGEPRTYGLLQIMMMKREKRKLLVGARRRE
jgi:hypothetical protein